MKRIKKTLCLMLVLALALGMVPAMTATTALALDDTWPDVAAIKEVEAVTVLNALDIMEGDNAGFRPGDPLTRAEAAAIVARTLLTRGVADRLPTTETRFRDVRASHWGSGYITYCDTQGIIEGYQGRFRPNDPVNGVEFAIMMLRALGYGKAGEYSGNAWAINAVRDGLRYGVLSGVPATLDFTAPATREQAALYTFNSLQLNMVEYNQFLGIYFDGSEGLFGTPIRPAVTLGRSTQNLFEVADDPDGFGYGQRVWKLNSATNVNILAGPFLADVSLFTSTNARTISALTTPGTSNFSGFVVDDVKALQYFWNGIEFDLDNTDENSFFGYNNGTNVERQITGNNAAIASSTSFTYRPVGNSTGGTARVVGSGTGEFATWQLAYLEAIKDGLNNLVGRRGIVVDLVDSTFNGMVDKVIIIEKTTGRVTSGVTVHPTTGAVTIPGVTGSPFAMSPYPTVVYPTLVANDIVLYVEDADGVTHIELAKPVEGQITRTNITASVPSITFGGATYQGSGLSYTGFNFLTFISTSGNLNQTRTAYLDDNGSIFFITGAAPTPTVYGIITALENTGTTVRPEYQAFLRSANSTDTGKWYNVNITRTLHSDWADKTVMTDILNAGATSGSLYDSLGLVRYAFDGDGNIMFAPVGSTASATAAARPTRITLGGSDRFLRAETIVIHWDGTLNQPASITAAGAPVFSTGPNAITQALASTAVRYLVGTTTATENQLNLIYIRSTVAAAPPANVAFQVTRSTGGADTELGDGRPVFWYDIWIGDAVETVYSYSSTLFNSGPGLYRYTGTRNDEDVMWVTASERRHIEQKIENTTATRIDYATGTASTNTNDDTKYYLYGRNTANNAWTLTPTTVRPSTNDIVVGLHLQSDANAPAIAVYYVNAQYAPGAVSSAAWNSLNLVPAATATDIAALHVHIRTNVNNIERAAAPGLPSGSLFEIPATGSNQLNGFTVTYRKQTGGTGEFSGTLATDSIVTLAATDVVEVTISYFGWELLKKNITIDS